ncbi:MAG: hypothetical protein ACFB21_07810 [Opitutales bacterium]
MALSLMRSALLPPTTVRASAAMHIFEPEYASGSRSHSLIQQHSINHL